MPEKLRLKHPVLVIAGPTASGKSAVAQQAALALGGEVVSADSMQVYKGMDIGTAKLKPEEQLVAHHLLSFVSPNAAFSAQQFQTQAREVFAELDAAGKTSVLCGGTGFYIQAALEAMEFPAGEQEENPFREHMQQLAQEHGGQYLWELLNERDPESAAVIHPNNTKRVIRALEMAEEGVSYAQQAANIRVLDEVVPSVRICLDVEPEALVERIQARVNTMFEEGLVDEVRALQQAGFADALTAREAIGYKEVLAYLAGNCTLEQAREQVFIATRRYAKRQRSWFRRDARMHHVQATSVNVDAITEEVLAIYRGQGA